MPKPHAVPAFARAATARKLRTLFAFLCAFIVHHSTFITPAFAQTLSQDEVGAPLSVRTVSPHFEHLTIQDGLSQSTIHDIFQDSRGFMWFTTQGGLNRYDGHQVKTFTHEPFDSTSLGAGFSMGMAEDDKGALWVGNASGLYRLDPLTERFTSYDHDPSDSTSLSNNFVWAVKFDSDGKLWVGTNNGLNVMDPENPGVFQRFYHDPDDSKSLGASHVYTVFEDNAGTLWFGTRNGISIMDRDNPGVFERLLYEDRQGVRGGFGAFENEAYGFLERPEEPGVLWEGTASGLIRIKVDTREIERFLLNPDITGTVSQNWTWRLAQDPANPSILWVPTFGGGLGRFDVRAKRFIVYHADKNDPNALISEANLSVYTDRSGIVWVGSASDGVSRFNPSSVTLAHYRASDRPDKTNLPGSSIWGIHETRDGVLWVGTSDDAGRNRLTAMDRSRGNAAHYEHRPGDEASIDPGTVGGIFEDRQGRLWITTDRGADVLDRSTGRFRHFRADRGNPSAIPGGANAFMEDRSGNLWIGASRGLARMRSDAFGEFEVWNSDADDSTAVSFFVSSIIEDLAGFLWLGTSRGVNRFDPESGTVTRYQHDPRDPTSIGGSAINVVLERRRESGIIWAASSDAGLSRLDTRTGTFTHFTERDGLPDNAIYGMLEDDLGRLWMSTNHGLSRFDPETNTFKTYGIEIGLQGLEFDQWAYHKSRSGEFFFGGPNGLNAFYPNELSENTNAPEVRLVDLKLFNKSVMETGAVSLTEPLTSTKEIRLDYSQKDLTFDFVAFHYANPSGNQYAYKLDGFNDDWVYVGGQRTASFTNLEPGEYTFRVKAANSDGIWNEEGASMSVIVEPPFWATWWFRSFALFGFVGLLYGGYTVRVRQIEERARKLEGEVANRTAELKESNNQLEQSHTIVEAINQETSFRRLLTKILEEARVMPGVEKATAIVYMPEDDRFHVRASSGWDVEAMQSIRLTSSQAHRRYVELAERVAEDIYVSKGVGERDGTDQMAEFGQVASFLVLRIRVDDHVVAYLVFDNLTDEDAFDQQEIDLLKRLREHITTAFIKTRILEDLQSTLDRLQSTQDRLVQQEKMASLGQLTAGIAHEIKNPLNFVNNFSDLSTELLADMIDDLAKRKEELPADFAADFEDMLESLRLNAEKIAEHGKRADGIVKSMLEHSKAGDGERTATDINDLVEEYLVLAHHAQRAEDESFELTIETNFDDKVGKVTIVPQELGRVFMNLIGNAIDVLRDHGVRNRTPTLTISTALIDGHVEVRIADNGPGIPRHLQEKIFEPFFTTKPTGSGTGLGLSMSYDIVTKGHGGTLDVESEEGAGATFIVRLPV